MLRGVLGKNHHPDLTSNPPQFFAAQFFTDAGPNRATRAGIKKALQRTQTHEGWAELLGRIFWACRAKKFIRFFKQVAGA